MEPLPVLLAAPSFLEALHKRRKQSALVDELIEAIVRLQHEPFTPALNVEVLFTSRGCQVQSARINIQYRLIFAIPAPDRLVLLHFDNHDEAYDWATAARDRVQRLIDRAKEWQGLRPQKLPAELPAAGPDDATAIPSASSLAELLEHGLIRYLAHLDPDQRHLTEFDFRERSGLMFIKGGAGTGKTAVAIHRLIHLARTPELDRGVLQYLCFNRLLAETTGGALKSLAPPGADIRASTFHEWSGRYLERQGSGLEAHENYGAWLLAAVSRAIAKYALHDQLGDVDARYVADEILSLIKPWAIKDEDEYVRIERVGRGRSLRAPQRHAVWRIYDEVRPEATGVFDFADIPVRALDTLQRDDAFVPYRYVVVDEAQDCTPDMAALVLGMVGGDHRRLMVLADPAQSIYASGFHISRRAFSPRGAQSVVLRVPYRSTKEIHAFASSLFVGASPDERETVTMRDPNRTGQLPVVVVRSDSDALETELLRRIRKRLELEDEARALRDSAVLTDRIRTRDQLISFLNGSGIPAQPLDREHPNIDEPRVKVGTVQAVKGLEFRFLYTFNLSASDEATSPRGRNLLYVAFTRSGEVLEVLVSRDRASSLLNQLADGSYELDGEPALVGDFESNR